MSLFRPIVCPAVRNLYGLALITHLHGGVAVMEVSPAASDTHPHLSKYASRLIEALKSLGVPNGVAEFYGVLEQLEGRE